MPMLTKLPEPVAVNLFKDSGLNLFLPDRLRNKPRQSSNGSGFDITEFQEKAAHPAQFDVDA
jgi:hypothetical protein